MALNTYNNCYRNYLTGHFEPLSKNCIPLVSMDMIKKHFSSIKQISDNIDQLDYKISSGDETIKLGIPNIEIKCVNCDTLQPITNDIDQYCFHCNQHPYIKTDMTLEDYLGVEEEKDNSQTLRFDN